MGYSGVRAWKEEGLSPEERVDRFFDLIDHACENGVPLESLYRREHLKELVFYALHRSVGPCTHCKKESSHG